MSKKILIIAGANGAGKTTFARSFLPEEAECLRFINADLIAAGLSPFAPERAAVKAGRLMLAEIHDAVGRDESFAFETTLAGLVYLRHISAMARTGISRRPFLPSLARRGNGDLPRGGTRASGRTRHPRRRRQASIRGRLAKLRPCLQVGGRRLGGV